VSYSAQPHRPSSPRTNRDGLFLNFIRAESCRVLADNCGQNSADQIATRVSLTDGMA
jgi:hypothetical protein